MVKKLLQIDACLNSGSTGRITEDIAKLTQKRGWECHIIHGSRYVNYPSVMKSFAPGSVVDEYLHYAEHYLFDNDGLASRKATHRAVDYIQKLKPDVIHIHDIHDHWINYKILFEFLNTLETPIIWTQHDCWTFTGDCGHFTQLDCYQWVRCCSNECPARKGKLFRKLINHTTSHFNQKKKLFLGTKNLTLIPVSRWLESELRQSFLKEKKIKTIYNGIDTGVFHPVREVDNYLRKYALSGVKYVVAVATAWSERKGFKDYCQLASMMPDDVKIVLVGLPKSLQKEALKYGVLGISRTENVGELVALYNGASIVMNLSYEETFGLTTVEGFACGTPSIVYNATASPELVTSETGIIVEPGDVEGVAKAVREMLKRKKPVEACRERAVTCFDKNDRFQEYIDLYEQLIQAHQQNIPDYTS